MADIGPQLMMTSPLTFRCGDQFDDQAVQAFNTCAVTQQRCVPQKVDTDVFVVPPDQVLDKSFKVSEFTGRWFITAGLNPLFDTFPC